MPGCGKQNGFADKTYVYEKEGFGGNFTITVDSDGTFQYHEGPFSSYFGTGTWELGGSILTFSDDTYGFENHFIVQSGRLLFRQQGSNNFLYMTVGDGEKFLVTVPAG